VAARVWNVLFLSRQWQASRRDPQSAWHGGGGTSIRHELAPRGPFCRGRISNVRPLGGRRFVPIPGAVCSKLADAPSRAHEEPAKVDCLFERGFEEVDWVWPECSIWQEISFLDNMLYFSGGAKTAATPLSNSNMLRPHAHSSHLIIYMLHISSPSRALFAFDYIHAAY